MPTWSYDELTKASVLFSVSEEIMQMRWFIIGGITRYVLEKDDEDLDELINESIPELDISKINRIASGLLVGQKELSHRIIHFLVNTNTYMSRTLQMGSSYISEKVVQALVESQHEDLINFFKLSHNNPILCTVRGNLFEAYAHRQLMKGGEFSIRSLSDQEGHEVKSMSIKPMKMERFLQLTVCKNNDVYYIPWVPNYPCIDAYNPRIGYFQMTIAKSHPIKETTRENLYFVVPRENFKDFGLQHLETTESDSTRKKRKPNQEKALPKQFVLCINIK